ncbi:hypothetical protein EPN90_04250 [Patescibacteria group bacterium]|nr:MAG: hypothetical protein EPN90_04250 [Patescibacteria group bacterium]
MTRRQKIILSLATALLLISVTFAALIVPTVKKILSIRGLINNERVMVEERYFHRQKVRKTIEYMTKIKHDLPELRALTLARGQEVGLVETIENLAAANSVQEKIRLIPPQGGPIDLNSKLTVELRLTGDPRRLGKFLSALERIDPLFNIATIEVFSTDKDGVAEATINGWISWPEADSFKL